MKSFQTVVAASKSGRSRHVATEDLHHQGRGPVASARLFVRWRQIRTVLSILAVAMSVLCRGVVAASAQESSHLTETVQQPTGSTDTQQDSSDIAKQAQNRSKMTSTLTQARIRKTSTSWR
jgi:hypothetical protein